MGTDVSEETCCPQLQGTRDDLKMETEFPSETSIKNLQNYTLSLPTRTYLCLVFCKPFHQAVSSYFLTYSTVANCSSLSDSILLHNSGKGRRTQTARRLRPTRILQPCCFQFSTPLQCNNCMPTSIVTLIQGDSFGTRPKKYLYVNILQKFIQNLMNICIIRHNMKRAFIGQSDNLEITDNKLFSTCNYIQIYRSLKNKERQRTCLLKSALFWDSAHSRAVSPRRLEL
jgi:hypothetical protein